jgi:Vitamin K-dependent gamma-carboxylase
LNPVQEIRQLVRSALEGWDRFWFTPIDPVVLGLIRFFGGSMMLYTHLVWSLGLTKFFADGGWLRAEYSRLFAGHSPFAWSYLQAFSSPAALWSVHIAGLVILLLFTLGLWTRITSVLAWVIVVAYANRAAGSLFGLDQINVMLAMYLMIGPSGAAFSLDAWLRRKGEGRGVRSEPNANGAVNLSISANISIRLIQLHMCLIYFFAGTGKLLGETWWNGEAMWGAIANKEYQSSEMLWMVNSPILINLLTHLAVFWELTYCALVWPRLTRPIVVALSIPLHLGIALFLGMITFGLAMMIGNLAFVSPSLVYWAIRRRDRLSPASN